MAAFTPRGGRREIKPRHRLNKDIRVPEVRVIDPEGKMLGVLQTSDALAQAEAQEMDLVEIAPQAAPPVCKIINYGKFIYEQQKREKQQKKLQHQQQMKEIRFKWRTDTHDFNFKTRHAIGFLESGNKVKGTVMFRGREIVHKEIGIKLLERFIEALSEYAKVDAPIRPEGRFVSVVLAPDIVKKKSKEKELEKEKEKSKDAE
jgi:translation initiation factor IF-3